MIWIIFILSLFKNENSFNDFANNFLLPFAMVMTFVFLPGIFNINYNFTYSYLFIIPKLIPLIIIWGIYIYFFNQSKKEKYLKKVCSLKGIGKVIDMEYSNIRINKRPLFNMTVEFKGFKRKIKNLPSNTSFHFKIGDSINIKYNPKNKKDIILDN